MKIKDITTERIRVPLIKPFKTALRTVECIEDVVLRVQTDDGMVALGEAPPTAAITGETLESVEGAVMGYIRPALLGVDILQLDTVMHRLHGSLEHNTSAKAAVDMAIYDLFARQCGLPLHKLLGGAKKELETGITISLNDTERMVEDSMQAVREGYNILKIKVGLHGFEDAARVAAVRKAVGKTVRLRVDANQGWNAKLGVRIIRAMEDMALDVELVEQPVAAHDIDGMQFVTSNVSTSILADESVFSINDAIEIVKRRAADFINIKLMKTGGIYKALEICSVAQAYGVQCMMGCMLESKLAVSAAAQLAAGKSVITMIDLDGPALCREDPFTGGPLFEGPRIIMQQQAGTGITECV